MSLARTLEIERKLVDVEDELGLSFAERLWEEEGKPADPAHLCRALEAILAACQREGVRYPAILLRRKKELQRGTWQPARVGSAWSRAGSSAEAGQPGAPGTASALGGSASAGVCKLCGGTGSITNPGGRSARFCECYLRMIRANDEARHLRRGLKGKAARAISSSAG